MTGPLICRLQVHEHTFAHLFEGARIGYGMAVAVDTDADVARLTDDFNPLPPETFDSAHADFARLRGECPVAHSQVWGGSGP